MFPDNLVKLLLVEERPQTTAFGGGPEENSRLAQGPGRIGHYLVMHTS